jgi:hypothetical protein
MYFAARAITTIVTITNAAICTQNLCKTAFACDLSIHSCITSLRKACGDPREATQLGTKRLDVASLFLGFRHCHPACFAVVGA